jgi:hypothetical protein
MQGIPPVSQGQSSGNIPIQAPAGISLALGEVVRGEVLNILPDAVSMRVKKEIVLAKADIPLEQGKSYLFRVESIINNQAKLKVIQTLTQEAEATNNTILKALESMKGAQLPHDQIIAFKRMLEQMPESVWGRLPKLFALQKIFKNIDSLSEGNLKESLHSSGGYFETKLRALIAGLGEAETLPKGEEVDEIIQNDLKGNLLKLKESLQDTEILDLLKAGGAKAEAFSEATDKLLQHIEQQQFTSKMNTAFQTFIPFVWQGLKEGNLTFEESYRAHEGEMEHSCVITLDLENAGRLVTQVQLFSDRLHLRFVTENPKLTTLLEENKPLLEKQLSGVGLTCNSLVITQEKTINFENFISPFELDIEV